MTTLCFSFISGEYHTIVGIPALADIYMVKCMPHDEALRILHIML